MTRRAPSWLGGALAFVVVAGDALPLAPQLTQVLGPAFLAAVLVARLRADEPIAAPPAALAAVGALFLWAAASALWTEDPAATRRVTLHFAREALLLAGLALAPGRGSLLRALAVGACLGGALLGAALLGVYLDPGDLRGVRVSVGEGEPGVQARAAAAGALLGVLAGTGRATTGAALLAALGVGLAGSRGAWAALGATALLGLLGPGVRPGRGAFAGLIAALVLGALLLGLRQDARDPLPGLDGDVEQLTSGRDAIWRNAAAAAADHPLRGVGAGALPAAYEPYRLALEAAGGPTSKPRRDAHSLYLGAFAELGLPGLLALLAVFGLGARAARAARDRAAALALALAALGGVTLVTWEHAPFWLLAGWALLRPGRAAASGPAAGAPPSLAPARGAD